MAAFFHSGHSFGFGGSILISKYRKKKTVESVVESRMPESVHRVWPSSVSEKSTLIQIGTEAPNIRRSGRKIQLRWLRNRFMKRLMRSHSGISGCLKILART